MRWYTCTPVDFGGGPDFFARDSGLMCRGLQAWGVECRAVMPGPARAGDEADLLRVDYRHLESSSWWREQHLDGVVLYAWGRPKFLKVAAAIRKAGVFLVLNQDNGGLVSPRLGMKAWLQEQRVLAGTAGGFAGRVLKGLTWGVLVSDFLRAEHLRQGNVIGCVSPAAADLHRKFCRMMDGERPAGKVVVLPHPVQQIFCYNSGMGKRRAVVAVGRWDDDVQKRPGLLMRVVSGLIGKDASVNVDIIGEAPEAMRAWWRGLPEEAAARVHLHGRLPPADIAGILAGAMVGYCPSAFESFHIASAEALCSGCSVVAARSPSLASIGWFVAKDSGTQAESDDADGHLAAILRELHAWDAGLRDGAGISAHWRDVLHADHVAERVLEMARSGNLPEISGR